MTSTNPATCRAFSATCRTKNKSGYTTTFGHGRNWLAALILVICLAGTAQVLQGEDDTESILKEARAAQIDYRQKFLQGIAFQYEYQFSEEGNAPSESHTNATVFYAGTSRIVEVDFPDDAPSNETGGQVKGNNADYAFVLSRKHDAQPWMVRDISTNPHELILKGTASELAELEFADLLMHRIVPTLDVEGIPLHRFFLDSGATIDGVKRGTDGRLAVHVSGDIQTPTGPDRVTGGTVWLLPDRSWALDGYELDLHTPFGKSSVTRKVTWTTIGDLPVPQSVVNRYVAEDAERLPPVENRWFFDGWERKDVEPERFLVSHYGLAEPGIVDAAANASGDSTRFWWLISANVAGLLLVVAGVWLRRMRTR